MRSSVAGVARRRAVTCVREGLRTGWSAVCLFSLALLHATFTHAAEEAESPAPDIRRGLVAYWRMERTEDGTLPSDIGRITGHVVGEYMFTRGLIDGCLTLQDFGRHVVIPNDESINLSGEISLAAWIRPRAGEGFRNILAHGYSLSPKAEVFLRLNGETYEVGAWDGQNHVASAQIPEGDVALTESSRNRWTHLAGTYDGTSWHLYRNGKEIASHESNVGAMRVPAPWLIGSAPGGAERQYFGAIDDLRIYRRSLTSEEVERLYKLPETLRVINPEPADQDAVQELSAAVQSWRTLLVEAQQYERAALLGRRLLRWHERLYGPDHLATGTFCLELSDIHLRLKDMVEAKRLAATADRVRYNGLGPDHLDTAAAKLQLPRRSIALIMRAPPVKQRDCSVLAIGSGKRNSKEAPSDERGPLRTRRSSYHVCAFYRRQATDRQRSR